VIIIENINYFLININYFLNMLEIIVKLMYNQCKLIIIEVLSL